MRLNRAIGAVLLIGLALSLVACSAGSSSTGGGSGTAPAGTSPSGSGATATTVVEKGFAFNPATLEVKVGDTVTFTNEDSAQHNVSIDGQELGLQDQGASVTWTAAKAGSFPYNCVIHPSMTGEIVVK